MKRVLILTAVLLGGCGADSAQTPSAEQTSSGSSSAEPAAQTPVQATPSPEQAAPSQVQMAQWSRNCALCHVRGEGGAPVLGDGTAWAERREQGEDALLAHTLEGLNNMPPLGYCMDCETDDFLALIRFMSSAR